jgi:hypothetical protein
MSATQPIPETCSSELSGLNFRYSAIARIYVMLKKSLSLLLKASLIWVSLKGNVKMHEEACSDGLEKFTAQITKWRDDSDQHTVEHALKFEILIYMDFNMAQLLCTYSMLTILSPCVGFGVAAYSFRMLRRYT